MSFFVYILKCADNTLYVGSTNDLQHRLHEHNHAKSGAHYTKIRRPVELRYFETVPSYSVARTREAELKRLSRAEKLQLVSEKPLDPTTAGELTPVEGESKTLAMCKEYLGKMVTITIDQPYGTTYKNALYTCNYGFVPGTLAPDGKELDAYFLGPKAPLETATGMCIAVIHREEDDDDKLVIVPEEDYEMTSRAISKAVHFREQYFKHTIIR